MMSDLLYRLRALFRRKSMEADLAEELRVTSNARLRGSTLRSADICGCRSIVI